MTMTTASLVARAQNSEVRDDDPAPKPVRRRFSTEYKLAILAEYDQLTESGAKGALLRREGLYSSHVIEWRRAKEAGTIAGVGSKRPGKGSGSERELERLKKRNARLEDQLDKHRKALKIQGKASELLARLLAESEDDKTEQQP
jgi:transposase